MPKSLPPSCDSLPIAEALPALRTALSAACSAVLQAPPGAGKTTVVPLALLSEPWLGGQTILMLEPRRLAARASAERMAALLGEPVGKTIGYRVRQDSKVSAQTRVEVVTEGILTRRLQTDPDLNGVGLVIFDEFHERSLNADLGLALCLDVQGALRDDLRLLVMSATLDAAPVAALLGDAPLITSQGQMFPVETRFMSTSAPRSGSRSAAPRLDSTVADAINHALTHDSGSVLVFLPGEREIRKVQSILQQRSLAADVDIYPLYGALSSAAQDAALRPSPLGRRKVVLATSIAETSLTIEGVRVVIDAGQARRLRFDPASGMSRLITTRVTRAEADQRRGRAGRREPGVCYRLWSEAEDRALVPFPPPEIHEADLAPLALDLAAWGAEATGLTWLDAPPAGAMAQGRDLLCSLGALDKNGRITAHGTEMARLPVHPRLAHMMLAATALDQPAGQGGLAYEVAALLAERDILRQSRDSDMRHRLRIIAESGMGGDRAHVDFATLDRVRRLAQDWRRALGAGKGKASGVDLSRSDFGRVDDCGRLLALAYPDRVGRQRGNGTYGLSAGRGAALPEGDPLARETFLAIADMDGGTPNGRIHRAAPVTLGDIEDLFSEQISEGEVIAWNNRDQTVQARKQRRFGALVLKDDPLPAPDPSRLAEGLVQGIRQTGLHVLPWSKPAEQFRARVQFLRTAEGEGSAWPDLSDQGLLDALEAWLSPYLSGLSRLEHLKKVPLLEALQATLTWEQQNRLNAEAPTHFVVPTGDAIPLDYSSGETPVLAVRLQQMFGTTRHPSIAAGAVPLVVHLLSPAHRPVQITRDVPGFWTSSYAAVKADLKGRYPKHPWPDNPLTAPATNRVKPRGT